jgi:hypothetical protein
MKAKTINLSQLACCPNGHALCLRASCYIRPSTVHQFRARIEAGKLVVTDQAGNPVKVACAGTTDNRTVYASVEGTGLIGGWCYPHRAMPWAYLAESINQGKVYAATDELPTAGPRKSRIKDRP